MATEKQREYVRKHLSKLDEIKVRPVAGTRDRWRAAAESQGKSLQRFIIDAVEAATNDLNVDTISVED